MTKHRFTVPLVVLVSSMFSLAYADQAGFERLLQHAYGNPAETLYCQQPFSIGDRVSIERAYSLLDLRNHFDCRTQRQCLNNPEFARVSDDLHNQFPIVRQMELERRRTHFSMIGDVVTADAACGYRRSFQNFEPPDHAKGVVARAVLYMQHQYSLPLIGPPSMYQQWHRQFPVTELEKRRNDVIEHLQGQRNPFIDDPSLVDDLF